MIFSSSLPKSIWATALALFLITVWILQPSPSAWGVPNIQPRTSNTTETNDDRIAQLFYKNDTTLPDGSTLPSMALCSASHVGNGKWVTAAHCLSDFSNFTGYIKQSDGESATVTSHTIPDEDVDIAVLTVGQGVEAESFDLPSAPATPGEKMTLIGFADERNYSSKADVEIEERIDVMDVSGKPRKGVYKSTALTPYRSCPGDSGGAVYKEDTLYGVHLGGEENGSCTDLSGSDMWHSDILTVKSFIEEEKGASPNTSSLSSQSSDS